MKTVTLKNSKTVYLYQSIIHYNICIEFVIPIFKNMYYNLVMPELVKLLNMSEGPNAGQYQHLSW